MSHNFDICFKILILGVIVVCGFPSVANVKACCSISKACCRIPAALAAG
jgi:hypothetical protein